MVTSDGLKPRAVPQSPRVLPTCVCPLLRGHIRGCRVASVIGLQAQYGWGGLAERVPLRCFSSEPSVASSLKFLR